MPRSLTASAASARREGIGDNGTTRFSLIVIVCRPPRTCCLHIPARIVRVRDADEGISPRVREPFCGGTRKWKPPLGGRHRDGRYRPCAENVPTGRQPPAPRYVPVADTADASGVPVLTRNWSCADRHRRRSVCEQRLGPHRHDGPDTGPEVTATSAVNATRLLIGASVARLQRSCLVGSKPERVAGSAAEPSTVLILLAEACLPRSRNAKRSNPAIIRSDLPSNPEAFDEG